MPDITARAQLRVVVLGLLKTIPAATVYCPGDWDVVPASLPAILLRPGAEEKKSLGNETQTAFDTVCVLEIRALAQANSGSAALAAIENLGAQIEEVLLKSIALRSLAQNFPIIHTETEINARGAEHVGGLFIRFGIEIREMFSPDITATLEELNVAADLLNVADPNGTYADPPFPDAVTAAPRTVGPDGRAEGVIDIKFPL